MKTILMSVVAMTLLFGIALKFAVSGEDGEYGEDGERSTFSSLLKRDKDVAPVKNMKYEKECGDCHMPYPAGLLPARSWQKIMQGLDDHFGDNAEVDAAINKEITDYLVRNSADNSNYRRSRRIMRSLQSDQVPLRITELSYFRREHREIPKRMIADNTKVNSLSNCSACHRQAKQGSFSEREINIPGYGRWDD
jgi:hypothetical protein